MWTVIFNPRCRQMLPTPLCWDGLRAIHQQPKLERRCPAARLSSLGPKLANGLSCGAGFSGEFWLWRCSEFSQMKTRRMRNLSAGPVRVIPIHRSCRIPWFISRDDDFIEGALRTTREKAFWVRPTESIRKCADPDDDVPGACPGGPSSLLGDRQHQGLPFPLA